MNKLAKEIAAWRAGKCFYTPSSIESQHDRESMLGKLMLVVTEVAEAAEAVRHNDYDNFVEEIADTMIRLLDIAGTMEIDISRAIEAKMKINADRPILHGKATSL